MSEQIENIEAPNWLKELEAKREQRLKAKLGHEAGAGAPCLTCEQKCPGLDLHFWRKICKNCKCAKENHDVHDDDIYGWAQFQLLGSKPNKSRKFKLPGRKDEIILEWTPKGHNETVDKFLKTLPPESLPVRGSAAAQERKQLLQKQIPIHDIDPTLCHDLTDSELLQMNEYIADVKENSVGIGHLVQLGLNRASKHTIGGSIDPEIFASRFPTHLSNAQNVQLQSGKLSEKLHNLNLEERKALNIIEDTQMGVKPGNILDVNYPVYERVKTPDMYLNYEIEKAHNPNYAERLPPSSGKHYHPEDLTRTPQTIENYLPGNLNKTPQTIGNVRDLALSTYDSNYELPPDKLNRNLPTNYPNHFNISQETQNPIHVSIGAINDIVYPTADVKLAEKRQTDFPLTSYQPDTKNNPNLICHRCKKPFEDDAIVIAIERSTAFFHSDCFKCKGCNQNLADMVYFYHKESDDIYCGRDYAKIKGIPRCQACDELIFVKQYCLAENATFHIKHFCCFECDLPLADQNYVTEDSQPFCLPCFENIKASKCSSCLRVIKPDETGAKLNDLHFHVNDECFACKVCKKPLLGGKLLLKNQRLYCSAVCYGSDK